MKNNHQKSLYESYCSQENNQNNKDSYECQKELNQIIKQNSKLNSYEQAHKDQSEIQQKALKDQILQNQEKYYSENMKNIIKNRKKRIILNQKRIKAFIKYFKIYQEQKQCDQINPKNKLTLTKIAQNLDCSTSTVYRLFEQYTYDPILAQKLSNYYQIKKKRGFQLINLKRMEKIKELLNLNPFFTQNQIVQQLNLCDQFKKNGKMIVPKTISRLLKLMKYTKKKIVKIPKYRNTQLNIQRRAQYCHFYKSLIHKKINTYFLDESAFNLFTIRNSVWSLKGQPVEQKLQFQQGKNVSIIAIISEKGILAYAVKSGNFKKKNHLDFIECFLGEMVKRKFNQKEYLIMDNCKIHDIHQTKQLATKCSNIEVVSLPPYSPQLNPIQCWFHELKSKVRKAVLNNHEQLLKQVKENAEKYKNCDFSNYYRGILIHVERGIEKKLF